MRDFILFISMVSKFKHFITYNDIKYYLADEMFGMGNTLSCIHDQIGMKNY